jgi:replicative DNA helicase
MPAPATTNIPRLQIRRQQAEPARDDQARDYLVGLVRLFSEDVAAARRVHRLVPADAFNSPVDRGAFQCIGRAMELSAAPNLLEAKFIAEHDDGIECAPSDVGNLLFALHSESLDRPTHLWIDTAAAKLRERHQRRQAADLGRAITSAADSGRLPGNDELEDVIRQARQLQLAGRPADATARDLLAIVDRWKLNKTEKLLPTGFGLIDQAFGGGLPVGVHGIAAKPTTGKSAIASQLALGAMLHNPDASVVWFRGEMTDDLLFSRMLACWSKMRPDTLQAITLRDALQRSPETKKVYLDLIDKIGSRFVTVDPPLTIASIEQHVDERKPSLVVIDYLQKSESPGSKDRRVELDQFVSGISTLSTRCDIPVIVISAVAGGRDESTDIGAVTKESNRLDYDAHTYVTLWNDGPKEESPRRLLMRINKSRTGQQRDDTLWFHGAHQYFEAAATYEEFDGFAPGGQR